MGNTFDGINCCVSDPDTKPMKMNTNIDTKINENEGKNIPKMYHFDDNKWKITKYIENKNKLDINALSIMSFNIWFSQMNWKERQNHLIQLLKEHKPNIFCFQEVTKQFTKRFCANKYIQKTYMLTDNNKGKTLGNYGVLIGCVHTFNVLDIILTPLPTFMSRKLLSVKLELNGNQYIWVNTVHLESKDNIDIRVKQMNIIFNKIMSKQKNAILTGDFNFRDNNGRLGGQIFENKQIPNEYNDCWNQYCDLKYKHETKEWVNMYENGWTRGKGKRFDRILIKTKQWKTNNFIIIGDYDNQTPSDHLGVMATIMKTVPNNSEY